MSPPESKAQNKKKSDIPAALFGWLVVLAVLAGAIYWSMPLQFKLAAEYNLDRQNIIVEPKPHGCDYDDAPLGNKHCHFEKEVEVERACSEPSCKVTKVYVTWRKVEE